MEDKRLRSHRLRHLFFIEVILYLLILLLSGTALYAFVF